MRVSGRKKGVGKTTCRFHCEDCEYFTNEWDQWEDHVCQEDR